MWINTLGWLAIGYVIGSIPTGYLAVRMCTGQDIRQLGSGNIGGTNVTRVLGKKWGIGVTIFDMLKGAFALGLSSCLASSLPQWIPIACAFAAVLGHNYPLWLKFKGGKGVATSLGTLAFIHPVALALSLILWLVTYKLTKIVAIASLVALASFIPLNLLISNPLGHHSSHTFWFSVALFLLSLWRHRSNLQRIIQGKEHRFS